MVEYADNKLHEIHGGSKRVEGKVESLMDKANLKWKLDDLQLHISSKFAAIRRTPILVHDKPDRLIWPFEKRVELTAKSICSFIRERKLQQGEVRSSSSNVILCFLLDALWNADVPLTAKKVSLESYL